MSVILVRKKETLITRGYFSKALLIALPAVRVDVPVLSNFMMTPEQIKYHAEILSNRVKRMYNHLRKRFARQQIDCFRLYDWDIPEVRAVVDWYAGHLVVAEYERTQTGPEWLPAMAKAVAQALNVPPENTHIKRRRTNTAEGPRYSASKYIKGKHFKVRERNLQFWVNLDDFLDTGLYSDHRDTRVLVGKLAAGKDFLNLFAYTGAFTCAAAAGGAKSTTTVDRSATYLDWAKENLALNGLSGPQHTLVQSDAGRFLERVAREKRRFTLAVVDPPSFFQDHTQGTSFDISRDHPDLIRKVLKVMVPGSTVFFSTNHQRFVPRLEGLPVKDLKELTPATIPEDYRNRGIHRCWRMTAGG
ncbi:MAG TPA: class I SAM-dependent methyltransferase [Candidatus Bathyarchaeia archaeon]|nr:class I SAM-dependent methyltransferase [Candidatus Bathyarchaeia archaeon]